MNKKLLLDSDELCYYGALFGQRKEYVAFNPDTKEELYSGTRKSEIIESIGNHKWDIFEREVDLGIEPAIEACRQWIKDATVELESNDILLMFNGKNNFRYEMATILPYKGNRDPSKRPIHLKECIEYIKSEHLFQSVDHLESDDLLAVNQGEDTIIVTQDKDLNTVSGLHYNPRKKLLFNVTEEEATRFHYTQMLTGDTSDNIPGLSFIGEKTAEKILGNSTNPIELYSKVLKTYKSLVNSKGEHIHPKGKKKGEVAWKSDKSVEDIVWEVANLLFMRRTLDPDERWEPPV